MDLDLNVCGNSISVIGPANPATGNYRPNGWARLSRSPARSGTNRVLVSAGLYRGRHGR